jgi:hypothetical protein
MSQRFMLPDHSDQLNSQDKYLVTKFNHIVINLTPP